MSKKKVAEKKLRITLVKSAIGYSETHKATIRALGLHRINQTVEQADTPVIRGMLMKVNHLVKIEEQEI
ncbi:MAG TPA: 50S ribosomal protein L30 [Anaerolineaceae bacterium]|jgi:large subunit ribosomal protein L30|nr:50S ribosomal protein L30 [Anaerolineaceae bacterium]HOV06206.1 50S ribosomal protein L30 [Anaerolineaceae bacterium]